MATTSSETAIQTLRGPSSNKSKNSSCCNFQLSFKSNVQASRAGYRCNIVQLYTLFWESGSIFFTSYMKTRLHRLEKSVRASKGIRQKHCQHLEHWGCRPGQSRTNLTSCRQPQRTIDLVKTINNHKGVNRHRALSKTKHPAYHLLQVDVSPQSSSGVQLSQTGWVLALSRSSYLWHPL